MHFYFVNLLFVCLLIQYLNPKHDMMANKNTSDTSELFYLSLSLFHFSFYRTLISCWCVSTVAPSLARWLASLWPPYMVTSDPMPWLWPAAGLTLALQPVVSLPLCPGWKTSSESISSLLRIPLIWLWVCCIAAALLKMPWSIWVTWLAAPAPSVKGFLCRHDAGEGLDKVTALRGRISSLNTSSPEALKWRLHHCLWGLHIILGTDL